jgi:diguanylate cyclase (GGDEF)-like protein/PAS domain S-box-containing protein
MSEKKASQTHYRLQILKIIAAVNRMIRPGYIGKDNVEQEYGLRKYVESGPDGVYLSDLNGTFIYGNQRAEKITGYSRQELIGHSYLDIGMLSDEYIPRVMKLLSFNLAGRSTGPDEFEIIRKDGKRVWVEITTSPIKEQDTIIIVGFVRDITYRKKLEEELKLHSDLLNDTGRVAMVGGWEYDINNESSIWTDEVYRILKQDLSYKPIFDDFHKYFSPPYLQAISSAFSDAIKNGRAFNLELQLSIDKTADQWVRVIGRASRKAGKIVKLMGTIQDITSYKHTEDLIKESEEKYRALTDNSFTGIYIHQNDKIVFVNKRFAEIHGYRQEELIGKDYMLLNHPDDRAMVKDKIGQLLNGKIISVTGENRRLKKDGTAIWCEMIVTIINYTGKLAIMGNIIDITEKKEAEQKLTLMATHDVLTGLPNRALLYEHFNIAMANAQRNKKRLAIMTVDLDKYKDINDSYGHATGDALLKAVADRFTSIVRKSDTVSRIGGDEFCLIIWGINEMTDAVRLGRKIKESFVKPFKINGININQTLSIGIAVYPENGDSIEELLKKSDEAMYQVKKMGRDNVKLYEEVR